MFKQHVAWKTSEALEERYRDKGSAKIKKGEFLLQDLDRKRNFDLHLPWSFIMKPGELRYMSIKFRDSDQGRTSCPHCKAENKIIKGEVTNW
jgi:hypothetical protein